jgi:hypothetical protein
MQFKRYFDKGTLCHYYVNTVYNTSSWRKPYCLRKEELLPFMTPDRAARLMQGLYFMWKARTVTSGLLKQKYHRIFDRTKVCEIITFSFCFVALTVSFLICGVIVQGRFYYVFSGKSKLIPRSSWFAPRIVKYRGFKDNIHAVYTEDVAAIIIQQKWRTLLMRRFLKALVRISYIERWDPIALKYKYINIDTDESTDKKPILLGSEAFDLNDVTIWTVEQTVMFIRRLGMRKYGYDEIIRKYKIDGQLLLFFQAEDFADVGIKNRVHIRRIEVELQKIFPDSRREAITAMFRSKREKMKRFKELEKAATDLQRVYRGHLARVERKYLADKLRIDTQERIQYERDTKMGTWWLQQEVPKSLSPIKDFGRRRDHFSVKGWGHYEGTKFISLNCTDEYLMSNITRKLTENLAKTGYDRRRAGDFRSGLNAARPKPLQGSGDDEAPVIGQRQPSLPPPPPPPVRK